MNMVMWLMCMFDSWVVLLLELMVWMWWFRVVWCSRMLVVMVSFNIKSMG